MSDARREDVTRAPCGDPRPRPAWPRQCGCGWLIAEHGQEKVAQDLEHEKARSKAPTTCHYCYGTDPGCGFCEDGRPLDTQEDWDHSWGRVLAPLGSDERPYDRGREES